MRRYILAMTAVAAAIGLAGTGIIDIARAADDPSSSISPAFSEAIPNLPGKSLVAIIIDYPPGGKTSPHRHARSAFVTGYVLSGEIRSQVDGGAARVYHAGESWTEVPGAHHTVSENASATKPAKLLAIFVLDSTETELTTIDTH